MQRLPSERPYVYGERPDMSFLLSFPFLFLSFYSLLSIRSLLFLFLSSSSDERMGKHIANARLNLSQVTTGFPPPRKVRERGCCSMGFTKATGIRERPL
jgi:hypothetical protein